MSARDAVPQYKVLVVGHEKSAKNLFSLAVSGRAGDKSEGAPTIGSTFFRQDVAMADQKHVCLEIWDTASQERYASLAPIYFRGAHVILLCFCTYAPETIQALKDVWIKSVRENAPNVVTMLVAVATGSHMDQAEVTEMEARGHGVMTDSEIAALAQELGVSKWASVMLDSPDQVKDVIRTVAEACVSRYGYLQPSTEEKEPSSEPGNKSTCNIA